MALKDRIALFESHIKPFGADIHTRIMFGKKHEFKVNSVPHCLKYDPERSLNYLRPHIPTYDIEKSIGYNLYCKAKENPSIRPEPNDNWMKPFGTSAQGVNRIGPENPMDLFAHPHEKKLKYKRP